MASKSPAPAPASAKRRSKTNSGNKSAGEEDAGGNKKETAAATSAATTTTATIARRRSVRRKKAEDPNVFLYIPNLIGYGRVVLALMSLFYMSNSPIKAMIMYFASAFLDAFDGAAARHFKQSSTFGAVLDMVSDRCTTMCLWVYLGSVYPSYTVVFQLLGE